MPGLGWAAVVMGAVGLSGGWLLSAPGTPPGDVMPCWVDSLDCWLRIVEAAGGDEGEVERGRAQPARAAALLGEAGEGVEHLVEPAAPLVAKQEVPSASEMRLALIQKHLLMAELALSPAPTSANKPKPEPPSPRSERRHETLNA